MKMIRRIIVCVVLVVLSLAMYYLSRRDKYRNSRPDCYQSAASGDDPFNQIMQTQENKGTKRARPLIL